MFRLSSSNKKEILTRSFVQNFLEKREKYFQKLIEIDENWQSFGVPDWAEEFVVLGIGGSNLGAKVLADVFLPEKKKIYFFDSIDPIERDTEFQNIQNLEKCLVYVCSKSGNTFETLELLEFFERKYQSNNLSLSKHFFVCTEEKESQLFNWSQTKKVKNLVHPMELGGRFSVFSPIGLFPAEFCGYSLSQIRQDLRWTEDQVDFLCHFCNFILESWQQEKWTTVFWSYDSRLYNYLMWLRQLWSESLSKSLNLKGERAPRASTPLVCFGSRDQHSFLQEFMEGYADKAFVFFSGPQKAGDLNEIMYKSTQKALTEKGSDCLSFELSENFLSSVPNLLYFSEIFIGILGAHMGIDAFNQPGVERVKVLVRKELQESLDQ